MGWYYVQTPDHNFPLEAVLRQCLRQHADKVLVVDDIWEGFHATVLHAGDDERVILEWQSVAFTRLKPGESLLTPVAAE
jgi:hypothetical protein